MKYKVYTKEKGLIETDTIAEIWHLTWHREEGPAYTKYYNNGKIDREEYVVYGLTHRTNGPASIGYNINGSIRYTEYYINGKELSFEEWKEHPLVKAETIEVNSKKELDALAKKDKEGTKTDDYFISSIGKYPVVYTVKESKIFESFKDKYIEK